MMQFSKQKLSPDEVKKEKLFKQIEKELDSLEVVSISDNSGHLFKIPSTTTTAIVYDLVLTDGSEIELWVTKDGTVGRVGFNGHAGTDKTLDTITSSKDEIKITPKKIGDEIQRAVRAENLKEQKGKLNKRSMEKLLDEAGSEDGADERLSTLKEDLTKGSGKFISLNKDGEFHGINGWTKKQSEIITFDTLEEAQKTENTVKVVKL